MGRNKNYTIFSNGAKLLLAVAIIVTSGLTFIKNAGYINDNDVTVTETIVDSGNNTSVANEISDEELQVLIDSIKIGENVSEYDRDDWTSSSQYYECNDIENHKHNNNDYNGDDNGEFGSIRAYSYYESEWYDWDLNEYIDPYSNETIYSIKECDYDHIIPLAYANNHGAASWSNEEKKAYADDPTVGVNCYASENRSKQAKGPSEWLPSTNVADYCYTWLVIADKYDLSISQDDMDIIKQVLSTANVNELSLINDYE